MRINAGGGQYTDPSGQVWQADAHFKGGSTYSTTAEIAKTESDTLYQTERWATNLSYEIPVANGGYNVNLHFAEIYWDDFNKRVFDIKVENSLAVSNLDIFASSKNAFFPGKNSALVQTVPGVFVSDGVLNIDLAASVDNAKISAIEVVPLTAPLVLFNQTGGSTVVSEAGGTDTYSVVLNTQPTANAVVSLQYDNQQIQVNKSSLTFTPSNWNVPQIVTLAAIDDTLAEGTHFTSIAHTITSADQNYNGLSLANIPITILDNDVVQVSFTKKTVATKSMPTVATWST
uniref:Malectin n=1 Tax=Desertifilum tharense IPPAS B-1220 TaxID=1781255 RepID=A0ACD5H4R3_9CYAN